MKRLSSSSNVRGAGGLDDDDDDHAGESVDDPAPGPSNALGLGIKTPLFAKHFSKDCKGVSKCNYCKKELNTPGGTTTTLIRHLVRKHPDKHNAYLEEKKAWLGLAKEGLGLKKVIPKGQSTLHRFLVPVDKYPRTSKKSKAIDIKIAKMLAANYLSFNFVNSLAFKDLLHELDPRYVVPSRTTFSRTIIPNLYNDSKIVLLKKITDTKQMMSCGITTDLWTSTKGDPYIALTCHFVDDNFEYQSITLCNAYFPGSHTSLAIYLKLKEMLADWNLIGDNISIPIFITTDNARNITNAIRNTEWKGILCFAHTLQLVITDAKKGIKDIEELLQTARAIVGHYKRSSVARERLRKLQIQLNKPEHELIQDVETRWNSEYQMLDRLVEQREVISAELSSTSSIPNLSAHEWKLAATLVQVGLTSYRPSPMIIIKRVHPGSIKQQ